MKTEQEKNKKQVCNEQNDDKKKLRDTSNEKISLGKQVITCKHLSM